MLSLWGLRNIPHIKTIFWNTFIQGVSTNVSLKLTKEIRFDITQRLYNIVFHNTWHLAIRRCLLQKKNLSSFELVFFLICEVNYIRNKQTTLSLMKHRSTEVFIKNGMKERNTTLFLTISSSGLQSILRTNNKKRKTPHCPLSENDFSGESVQWELNNWKFKTSYRKN